MDYVESYYKVKLEHLTKNKLLMEELKKKYDFYLYFSQSALKRENQADLDMTKYAAHLSYKYINSNIVI